MASHYYAIAAPAQGMQRKASNIVVGTSSDATAVIELRILDNSMSRQQARAFCQWMDQLIATNDFQVIKPGFMT